MDSFAIRFGGRCRHTSTMTFSTFINAGPSSFWTSTGGGCDDCEQIKENVKDVRSGMRKPSPQVRVWTRWQLTVLFQARFRRVSILRAPPCCANIFSNEDENDVSIVAGVVLGRAMMA